MTKLALHPSNAVRLSRRRFLKSGTAVTGTLLLGTPALLLGKGLNEKLNIGIIGAGGRAGR